MIPRRRRAWIHGRTGPGAERRGAFIDSVLSTVDVFYAEVLESLRSWTAAPPKLRAVHPVPPDIDDAIPSALVSTDFSSQDGSCREPSPLDASDSMYDLEAAGESVQGVSAPPTDGDHRGQASEHAEAHALNPLIDATIDPEHSAPSSASAPYSD